MILPWLTTVAARPVRRKVRFPDRKSASAMSRLEPTKAPVSIVAPLVMAMPLGLTSRNWPLALRDPARIEASLPVTRPRKADSGPGWSMRTPAPEPMSKLWKLTIAFWVDWVISRRFGALASNPTPPCTTRGSTGSSRPAGGATGAASWAKAGLKSSVATLASRAPRRFARQYRPLFTCTGDFSARFSRTKSGVKSAPLSSGWRIYAFAFQRKNMAKTKLQLGHTLPSARN